MKCPFRMKALDHPDTCDKECAWLIIDRRTLSTACAISALASKGDFFVINYEQYQGQKHVGYQEEKPVGALGRYSEKE